MHRKTISEFAMNQFCVFSHCYELCELDNIKCSKHRTRCVCRVPLCTNIVFSRQLCVRHGGKRSCADPDCGANARSGGFCSRHIQTKIPRFCSLEGCYKVAHQHGKCISHGGRRQCQEKGCTTHARKNGRCHRHREKNLDEEIDYEFYPQDWEEIASLCQPNIVMLEESMDYE
ncbi:hypothetical protein THRCLA_20825 [Thraustotheca clavata]|uniref:WRKY19-like zinc finger domain-containing protein n=1 Tax=Thraustotheca clavata TaxID=74557 RepID=A0A1W0A3A8_9STRA|nr:hypothetical protein THRCLA_20825 [Thraustotheca clavata]